MIQNLEKYFCCQIWHIFKSTLKFEITASKVLYNYTDMFKVLVVFIVEYLIYLLHTSKKTSGKIATMHTLWYTAEGNVTDFLNIYKSFILAKK